MSAERWFTEIVTCHSTAYSYLWLFKSRKKFVDDLLFLIWFLDVLGSSDGRCWHFRTCITCITFETVSGQSLILSLLSFLQWWVRKTRHCTQPAATMVYLLQRVAGKPGGFVCTDKCSKAPATTCHSKRLTPHWSQVGDEKLYHPSTPSSVHWRRFYFQLTRVHSAFELFGRRALQIYLLTYLLIRSNCSIQMNIRLYHNCKLCCISSQKSTVSYNAMFTSLQLLE